MNTKSQTRDNGAGKVESTKHRMYAQGRMYGDTDLSNLEHLERGDLIRVAARLRQKGIEVDHGYVSKVKKLVVKNTDIMTELLKLGGENRAKLKTAAAA